MSKKDKTICKNLNKFYKKFLNLKKKTKCTPGLYFFVHFCPDMRKKVLKKCKKIE